MDVTWTRVGCSYAMPAMTSSNRQLSFASRPPSPSFSFSRSYCWRRGHQTGANSDQCMRLSPHNRMIIVKHFPLYNKSSLMHVHLYRSQNTTAVSLINENCVLTGSMHFRSCIPHVRMHSCTQRTLINLTRSKLHLLVQGHTHLHKETPLNCHIW